MTGRDHWIERLRNLLRSIRIKVKSEGVGSVVSDQKFVTKTFNSDPSTEMMCAATSTPGAVPQHSQTQHERLW